MNLPQIAAVGVPEAWVIGINHICSDLCVIKYLKDFNSISSSIEDFSGYIVNCTQLLQHLNYFLRLRNQTIAFFESGIEIKPEEPVFKIISIRNGVDIVRDKIEGILPSKTEARNNPTALSQREIQVLREIASGKTNKEIADTLCISVNTVITHRKNISSKLEIRSASGLALYAMMNGIL